MNTQEIIDKLPPELQESAGQYLSIVMAMTKDEIDAWIDQVLDGDWQSAYKLLASKMSTEELLAELQKQNEKIKAINQREAEAEEAQRKFVKDVLDFVWKLGMAYIGLPL